MVTEAIQLECPELARADIEGSEIMRFLLRQGCGQDQAETYER